MIRALLTIDDITSRNTPAIVDYLNKKGITAIMFAVGEKLDRLPDEAAYALSHGMVVGNHSDTHPHFSAISLAEGISEIERCEEKLDRLYDRCRVERKWRPFRFPYGDKGGGNKDALQKWLRDRGFSKVKDTDIPYPWWRDTGRDRELDTLWTFDFTEYRIRPGSGYTMDDVLKRVHDPQPETGAPLLQDNGRHILLLHAHDETEEMAPGYYRTLIDLLTDRGVEFIEPEFIRL